LEISYRCRNYAMEVRMNFEQRNWLLLSKVLTAEDEKASGFATLQSVC
jgi:hypothetical protein